MHLLSIGGVWIKVLDGNVLNNSLRQGKFYQSKNKLVISATHSDLGTNNSRKISSKVRVNLMFHSIEFRITDKNKWSGTINCGSKARMVLKANFSTCRGSLFQ